MTRRQLIALAASAAAGKEKAWEGIFVIMQTPFLDSLEIDEESLRKETDFLARCRVHGIVWPAGAGETNSLSHAERVRYSKAVVDEAKGRTTVLGVQPHQALARAVQFPVPVVPQHPVDPSVLFALDPGARNRTSLVASKNARISSRLSLSDCSIVICISQHRRSPPPQAHLP
jgi:hypothetical protein